MYRSKHIVQCVLFAKNNLNFAAGGVLEALIEPTKEEAAMAREVTLERILIFITGADRIPPGGFPQQPTIQFVHEADTKVTRYNSANSCACTLHLVVSSCSYEQFAHSFITTLINGKDFSKL